MISANKKKESKMEDMFMSDRDEMIDLCRVHLKYHQSDLNLFTDYVDL